MTVNALVTRPSTTLRLVYAVLGYVDTPNRYLHEIAFKHFIKNPTRTENILAAESKLVVEVVGIVCKISG